MQLDMLGYFVSQLYAAVPPGWNLDGTLVVGVADAVYRRNTTTKLGQG
jgi:hypothetical protein